MPLLDEDSGWDTPAQPVEYETPAAEPWTYDPAVADQGDAEYFTFAQEVSQAFESAEQSWADYNRSGPLLAAASDPNKDDKTETFASALLKGFKKIIGWDETPGAKNELPKALITAGIPVIGGILGGIGTAYSNTKKLAQERDLAQQQLAISQQKLDLEAKKSANQNLAGYGFGKPKNPVGLINNPAVIRRIRAQA